MLHFRPIFQGFAPLWFTSAHPNFRKPLSHQPN